MDHYSYLSNTEPAAIDELYANYLKDPNTVDPSWGRFFEGVRFAGEKFPVKPDILNGSDAIPENVTREFKVINLINGYRSRGHLFTKTNPVRERRQYMPTMAIENFGLESTDLNTVFQAGTITGIGPSTLQAIIQQLEETYCQSIGVEYM